jgi:hypothetical protein
MTTLKFQRNEKSGNLYTKVGRVAVAVYYTRLGSFAWRIRTADGEDRHSQHNFDTERAALEDLLDNVVELQAIAEMLAEAPRDDDDTA